MGSSSSTSVSTWSVDGETECLLLAVTWDVTESHLDHFRRSFPKMKIIFHKLKPSYDPADVPASSWEQATVLLTYCILPPNPESAPRLRFIQLMSAGSNHIQQSDFFKSGRVPICSANGLHGPQIAEYVMGTVLSFHHQFPRYLKSMEARKWDGPVPLTDDGGEPIEDMVGKRIGILGYGAIGRQVARVASGMGMDVLAYTFRERSTVESRRDATYAIPRTGDPDGSIPSAWYHGSSVEAVNKFLGQDLDVLVISLPLTQFTRGLISAPQFEILSTRRTFVVSVARGAVVNTSDIHLALENGLIAGAALDVTDPEPLPADHPLWGAKNLFITPHVSGDSARYKERLLGLLASNISRVKEGIPLQNVVDRHLGY